MEAIDPRLWHPLFDAVYEVNTARDHADFISAVIVAMNRLIPSDFCQVHVLDRNTKRLIERAHPANLFSPEEMAYYAAHPSENPLVAHYESTGETRALRFSDVTKLRQLRRTEFYRQCLQRTGNVYCLALPVSVDKNVVAGLVFSRSQRDFTRRHCALLDAFAPHFLLAWQRHENPWIQAADADQPVRVKLRKLGLTDREADVLFWITEGKQNREIAMILGRSLCTVQEHVSNILRKLNQENRHAATVFALRWLAN